MSTARPDQAHDFGVARVTDADRTSAERTQAGTVVGTPAYMSPEQLQGLPIDRRTDVFSAGVILYQFSPARSPSPRGRMDRPEEDRPGRAPGPSSINVALSPEFDRVAKALAKDPNQRFATARQFGMRSGAPEGKPAVPEAEPTRRAALHPCSAGHSSGGMRSGEMSSNSGARSRTATTERLRTLRAAVSPRCLCVARGTQGRQAAQRLPADDSGTRTMAGATGRGFREASARRSRAPGEARSRGERAVEKTVKLAERCIGRREEIAAGARDPRGTAPFGAAAYFL